MLSGGVFLGVALTHTIPETYEGIEAEKENLAEYWHLVPIAGIIIGST